MKTEFKEKNGKDIHKVKDQKANIFYIKSSKPSIRKDPRELGKNIMRRFRKEKKKNSHTIVCVVPYKIS